MLRGQGPGARGQERPWSVKAWSVERDGHGPEEGEATGQDISMSRFTFGEEEASNKQTEARGGG